MEFFIWGILVLIVNGLLSLMGAYIASEKGRSGPAFWFLGFIFSFLIGLIVAVGVPRVEKFTSAPSRAYTHKKCHACKEEILIDAVLCRYCQSPQEPVEVTPEGVRSWCPACRTESVIPAYSACPNCGKATHPWE
jgi:hypothetical protein